MNGLKRKVKQVFSHKYYKDFQSFGVGYIISSSLAYLIIFLVNKNTTPTELGKYSYYKGVFEIAHTVLSLSIYSSYLRFNIAGSNRKLFNIVMKVVSIAILLTSVIIYYFTKSILCIGFALIILVNERTYFFRSILETTKLNLIRIAPSILTLVLIAAYIYTQKRIDTEHIFLFYGLGFLIVFFFYREMKFESLSPISEREIFRFVLPSVGLVFVDAIQNFSAQLIIKHHYHFEEVAKFAVAQQSLLTIKLFSGVFLMFYPTIYFREMEKRNKKFITQSRNLIIAVIFILITVCFFNSRFIYRLMGAEKYIADVNLFRILLVAELIRIMSSFYGLFLTYKIKALQSLYILSLGAVLNLVLMLVFIEGSGIILAAYSILVSNLLVLALLIVYSLRREQKFLSADILHR